MSSSNRTRPLSPHLTIWRWGPHMAVSILHRAAGAGMATVGAVLLVWWLVALATGPDAYAGFVDTFTVRSGELNILGYLFGIGLTASLLQHIGNGVRHFFMDVGANYELKGNKLSAQATWVFAGAATVLFWAYLLLGRN
jgi:succinate dehydrogenase / fumarate reductase, cytochrome b subunit